MSVIELTAEAVVALDTFYSPRQVEQLLGIPENDVRAAGRRHAFVSVRGSVWHIHNYAVLGECLLAWIRREHVLHAVQPGVLPLSERRPVPKSPPPPDITPLAQAVAADAADQSAARAEGIDELWDTVARLVAKNDRTDDEQDELIDALRVLNLSAPQIADIERTVRRAAELIPLHDSRPEACAAFDRELKRFHETEKRCKEEVAAARKAMGAARDRRWRSCNCYLELQRLAAAWPGLFVMPDHTGNIPRLRGAE